MCYDWFWKNWYDQAESSLKNPTGPELKDFAATKDNALVRVVRGGDGNTDAKQVSLDYRQDFNKTWYQYAINATRGARTGRTDAPA